MTTTETFAFEVEPVADGEATDLLVTPAGGSPRRYRIEGGEQDHYTAFYEELARDFGTSLPHRACEPRWCA